MGARIFLRRSDCGSGIRASLIPRKGLKQGHGILAVDRNKFAALSHKRISHIARDDFLAIDLVAACLFSQRLVPAPISVAAEPNAATEVEANQVPQLQFKSNTQLDDSELFSFDAFVSAGTSDD